MNSARLGFIGPVANDGGSQYLERAAGLLLDDHGASRAIYLGDQRTFEETVASLASQLVGTQPTDDAIWQRAKQLVDSGPPGDIDEFVRREHARNRLRALERLADGAPCTIEIVGRSIAVVVHDKSVLDEEDIFSADIVIYGHADAPLVRRIGTRWFITPGPLGPAGGLCLFDEADDQAHVTILTTNGETVESKALPRGRTNKLRVQA